MNYNENFVPFPITVNLNDLSNLYISFLISPFNSDDLLNYDLTPLFMSILIQNENECPKIFYHFIEHFLCLLKNQDSLVI